MTKRQIRAAIHIVGIYCGEPLTLECFRSTRKAPEVEELLQDAYGRSHEGKPLRRLS